MPTVATPEQERTGARRRGVLCGGAVLGILGACAVAVLAAPDRSESLPGTAAQAQVAPKLVAISETAEVRSADLTEVQHFAGEVKALRRVALSAQVAGIVGDVTHLPGQQVAPGALMLAIAPEDHRLALEGAEAMRKGLVAQLTVARSTLARATQLASSGASPGAALEQAQSAVAVLEAGVAEAEIRVRQADLNLQRARIKAPFAGTLASRSVEPGQLVQTGDALFEIVDLDNVTVEALVPVAEAARLQAGQDAVLWAPEAPAMRIPARVARVAPQVTSGTRSVAIWLEIDNRHAGLRVGSFLKGEITIRSASARMVLPAGAIRADGSVLVLREGHAVALAVTLGPVWNGGALVEVSGDLAPGERVLALHLQGLDPGDAIRLRAE